MRQGKSSMTLNVGSKAPCQPEEATENRPFVFPIKISQVFSLRDLRQDVDRPPQCRQSKIKIG